MAHTTYTYQKQVNQSQLSKEIHASEIVIGLHEITVNDADVEICFKSDLPGGSKLILDEIVAQHVPVETKKAEAVKLDSPATTEDGIPYVYTTSKPLDHYTVFQGAGDSEDRIGGGTKCVFHLTSKIDKVTKDFTFNEDIYVKDGFIIVKDAPIGACFDIDLVTTVEPLGEVVVATFGRSIPVYGTGWFPLNTEDRGKIAQGLILRITVHNSKGGNGNEAYKDEDPPSSFFLAGRFEMYRAKWGLNGTPMFNR